MNDWRSITEEWPVADPLIALDRLTSAGEFLRRQFGIHLPRPEAQALMDAQALLINVRMRVLDEAEAVWDHFEAKGKGGGR
jgi:hypothetical protein